MNKESQVSYKIHHLCNPDVDSDVRGQFGVVTIVSSMHDNPSTAKRTVYWGMSICSPSDNFSKKEGVDIAVDRLKLYDQDGCGAAIFNGEFEYNLDMKYRKILFFLLANILATKPNLPYWAKARIFNRMIETDVVYSVMQFP